MIAKELTLNINRAWAKMGKDDHTSNFPDSVCRAITSMTLNEPTRFTVAEQEFVEELGFKLEKARYGMWWVSVDLM